MNQPDKVMVDDSLSPSPTTQVEAMDVMDSKSDYDLQKSKMGKDLICDEDTSAMLCENGYVMLVSHTPGGGITYIKDNVEIKCPVVDPQTMSEECREMLDLGLECEEVICTRRK